jgi:hypothetical protein
MENTDKWTEITNFLHKTIDEVTDDDWKNFWCNMEDFLSSLDDTVNLV